MMKVAYSMTTGPSHDFTTASWFAPALALSSSVFTGFVLWAGQRLVGKAAWQAAMTAANKDFIDQLQEERNSLREEFEKYKLEAAAREASRRGEILNLTQALESLKAFMRREGIEVPEAPYHPTNGFMEIKGDKE